MTVIRLSEQEKQNLIDTKDWDYLSKSNFLVDFDLLSNAHKYYTITKEFFLEFFVNKKYMLEALKGAHESLGRRVFGDDVARNMFEAFNRSGIKLTQDDWKQYIIGLHEIYLESLKEDAFIPILHGGISEILNYKDKGHEYVANLLDDDLYKKLAETASKTGYSIRFEIRKNTFDGFSDDEVRKILSRLVILSNATITYIDTDLGYFEKKYFKNDIYNYIKTFHIEQKQGLDVAFEHYSFDEYVAFVVDVFNSGLNGKYPSLSPYNLMEYFNMYSGDQKISDKDLAVFATRPDLIPLLINVLTIQQIEQYKDYLPASIILMNHNLTVNQVAKIKNMEITPNDIQGQRFFTDEEMREYPKAFLPRRVLYRINSYLTRETLKVLNRTHGERSRYKSEYLDFLYIFKDMKDVHLKKWVMEYLVEKTKPGNEKIIQAIRSKSIVKPKTGFANNINRFKKFIIKFSE